MHYILICMFTLHDKSAPKLVQFFFFYSKMIFSVIMQSSGNEKIALISI